MSRPTEGPWLAEGNKVWSAFNERMTVGGDPRGSKPVHKIADTAYHVADGFGVQKANARLIAAAPEMYAALEAAKYALKELSFHVPYGSDEYDLGGDVYSQIDDALSKARGEQA